MTRWLSGEPYEDCLVSKLHTYLISVKRGECHTLSEAVEIANSTVADMKARKDKYMTEVPVSINPDVDPILNQVLVDLFKFNFKSSI